MPSRTVLSVNIGIKSHYHHSYFIKQRRKKKKKTSEVRKKKKIKCKLTVCHQQFRRGTNVQIPTFKCSYYPAPNIILKYKVLKGKSSSDLHGYTCNLKFPTLVSRDAQGSFTLCVLHTATILVFDRVLVWLSQVRLCPTQTVWSACTL